MNLARFRFMNEYNPGVLKLVWFLAHDPLSLAFT